MVVVEGGERIASSILTVCRRVWLPTSAQPHYHGHGLRSPQGALNAQTTPHFADPPLVPLHRVPRLQAHRLRGPAALHRLLSLIYHVHSRVLRVNVRPVIFSSVPRIYCSTLYQPPENHRPRPRDRRRLRRKHPRRVRGCRPLLHRRSKRMRA